MPGERTYHHGDLRRAVLTAALDVIAADGPDALSLRDLARRAGVSHAAPAHHFKDRTGLLTAVAAEGYALFADALAKAPGLQERGVAYVRFASTHPAHFQVMFRPELHRADDPALLAARARATEALRSGVDGLPEAARGEDARLAGVAAWSLAHGFATLLLSGNLSGALEGRAPEDAFRTLAGLVFARGAGGDAQPAAPPPRPAAPTDGRTAGS
ncbi:TetR/AcrR family transcriptional regulator [Streptomyces nitrosporeus]|uniref:TetR/AcrR family transcriptional regulator n=1 Tax=Streptomyces nitrosporeus TaxID=28894 RepID=A0A5J6FCN0_9ACTN|nr:TetR/AcrR family transcriptional regulator [Streptomyces nitrosporeus]QEU74062.1 TetR/AcrR family transcriptional regulator [Streptomyces nitrosporeus]GGZ00099.1 TetR family transcriptional regulator [Streptomyces nitrosporeus]